METGRKTRENWTVPLFPFSPVWIDSTLSSLLRCPPDLSGVYLLAQFSLLSALLALSVLLRCPLYLWGTFSPYNYVILLTLSILLNDWILSQILLERYPSILMMPYSIKPDYLAYHYLCLTPELFLAQTQEIAFQPSLLTNPQRRLWIGRMTRGRRHGSPG